MYSFVMHGDFIDNMILMVVIACKNSEQLAACSAGGGMYFVRRCVMRKLSM